MQFGFDKLCFFRYVRPRHRMGTSLQRAEHSSRHPLLTASTLWQYWTRLRALLHLRCRAALGLTVAVADATAVSTKSTLVERKHESDFDLLSLHQDAADMFAGRPGVSVSAQWLGSSRDATQASKGAACQGLGGAL